jgi:hypothetical protein
MFSYQAISRFQQKRDEYLIEANNSLVAYWSFFQTILIILSAMFQIYFIKKMFTTSFKNKK